MVVRLAGLMMLAALVSARSGSLGPERTSPRRTRPIGKNSVDGMLAQRPASSPVPAPLDQAATAVATPSPSAADPDHVFDSLDSNHDGLLDRKEFKTMEDKLDSDLVAKAFDVIGSGHSFWGAFANSLLMIIVTELGDKTFFLAALMAMRHPRMAVFLAAISALAVMHVLSVAIGFALPALLPRVYTHYAATAMFLFFGVQLLWDSRKASSDASEGLEEAEEELGGKEKQGDESYPLADEEAGSGSLQKRAFGARPATDGAGQRAGQSPSVVATMTPLAVMAATFTMTFVAEWGDRSQIATIAMGAAKDPLGVCVGGVLGHALCTGLAVLGGKLLSTKISEKAVLIVGGVVFLAFGIHSVWAGPSA